MADLHVKYNTANNHIVRISVEPIAVTEVGFALAKIVQVEREENGQTVYNVKPGDEIAFYMSANGVDEDGYITDYSSIRQAPEAQYMLDKISQLSTESVDTMLALTEVYETNAVQDAAREQEGVDTMLALTEAYELILQQQTTIEALIARIEALEGGAS